MVWEYIGTFFGIASFIISYLAYRKLKKSWSTQRGIFDVELATLVRYTTFSIEGTGTFDFLSLKVEQYLPRIKITIYADDRVVWSERLDRLIDINSEGIKVAELSKGISFESSFSIKFSKLLHLEIQNNDVKVASIMGYYQYSMFE